MVSRKTNKTIGNLYTNTNTLKKRSNFASFNFLFGNSFAWSCRDVCVWPRTSPSSVPGAPWRDQYKLRIQQKYFSVVSHATQKVPVFVRTIIAPNEKNVYIYINKYFFKFPIKVGYGSGFSIQNKKNAFD